MKLWSLKARGNRFGTWGVTSRLVKRGKNKGRYKKMWSVKIK